MLKVPQQCCTLRVECAWQTKPITAMVQVCTLVCTNFALIKIMKSFQLGKETLMLLMLLSLNLNNNHLLHSSCNLQNGFTKLYFKTSHKCVVQWRSEYGTSLVFKWSKKSDAKWSSIQMQFEYLTAPPFSYQINECHLVLFYTGLDFWVFG